MFATFQLCVLPRSVLMLRKILHTTCRIASLPLSLPFSSHQLCSLLLSGEKSFSQHANFAAEQAHLYLVKGRLPQMCPLSTLCFCGRRGLLALGVPVLSWLHQDHDDGLQKSKKGKKAPAAISRNGSNVLFMAWKNSIAIHSGSSWLWTFLDGSHAQISVLQLVSRRAACRAAAGLQYGRMQAQKKIWLVVVWSQCWLGTGN